MKKSKFQDIVSRAMTDEDFLNEFLSDPMKATADYNLSKEEASALNAINREELAQIGDELGERISKGYIDLSMLDMIAEHQSQHTNNHASTHDKKPPELE